MDYEQIKAIVKSRRKGTFANIHTRKALKTYKGITDIIEKQTVFSGRLGVTYDNISKVQEKRKNGELPKQNDGLTWGEWEEFPYFIKNGNKRYLRISLIPNTQFDTVYFKNGIMTTKQDIEGLVTKANFSNNNSDTIEVLTIDINNIVDIK